MPKGEKHYKTAEERAIYKASYAQVYWARRNMERFEAKDPVFMKQIGELMAASTEVDRRAVDAGFTEDQIERIHARAMFDALLKISREGGYKYVEYYVVVERTETQGEYLLASRPGDAPEELRSGKQYTTFQLTEFEALVHCYYGEPITHQEALVIVMQLQAQGSLGNAGQEVET